MIRFSFLLTFSRCDYRQILEWKYDANIFRKDVTYIYNINYLIEKFNQIFIFISLFIYMVYLTQVVCVVFSSCDTKHIFSFLINFIMNSFIRKSLIIICQSYFGLSMIDEDRDLFLLQWIPILHKCSYKQCCIA